MTSVLNEYFERELVYIHEVLLYFSNKKSILPTNVNSGHSFFFKILELQYTSIYNGFLRRNCFEPLFIGLETKNRIMVYHTIYYYNIKTNYCNEVIFDSFLAHIYWLDLIRSYRGWRHLVGLPVRGQRTWTNGWSVYRSNLYLREFVVELVKVLYDSNSPGNRLSMAYMAEQVNRLWAVQWHKEWKAAKKNRKRALKQSFREYKVDMNRLALGNVNTKKVRKNRRKLASEKRNIFILGFDKNFSKYLLEHNTLEDPSTQVTNDIKTRQQMRHIFKERAKLKVVFALAMPKKIRKKLKKKTEIFAKKKKHIIAKKNKKSVWA